MLRTAIDNTETSFLIGRSKDEPLPFIWVGTTHPAFWNENHMTSMMKYYAAFVLDPDGNNIEAGIGSRPAPAATAAPSQRDR